MNVPPSYDLQTSRAIMDASGIITPHVEGATRVPLIHSASLAQDDWFQLEEDGSAGDTTEHWPSEFFSQFDGSSHFPQQDDMEVDSHVPLYQVPGAVPLPVTSVAAPSRSRFSDIIPLPSTPFQPSELPSTGATRSLSHSLQDSPHVVPQPGSVAPEVSFSALTPPGAVEVIKSPIVISPRALEFPRRYRVGQQKMPKELPSHSSSSIERRIQKDPEPAVEVIDWETIQQELLPEALASDKPTKLFSHLRHRIVGGRPMKPKFVPTPTQVADIMLALKQYASNVYLRRMADDERYTYIFSEWLSHAGRDLGRWAVAVPHIFAVLARTDIPMNYLRAMKIGSSAKQVLNVAETARLPPQNLKQIQASYNDLHDWIKNTLIPNNREHISKTDRPSIERPSSNTKAAEEGRPLKRTKVEGTPAPTAGPSRPKTIAPPPRPIPRGSAPASDMTFFDKSSANPAIVKAKARFPEGTNREPSIPVTNALKSTGGTSYVDPVASALESLRQGQSKSIPFAVPTKPPPTLAVRPSIRKPNRKGHFVRFRDDVSNAGVLVSVRHFTQEPHEHEPAPWSNIDGVGNGNDNVAEGEALRVHGEMEEEVAWYEPLEIVGALAVLSATQETLVQEIRERGLLGSSDEVDTPSEDTVDVVSTGPRTGIWKSFMSIPPPTALDSSHVSALINRLNLPVATQQNAPSQYQPSQWGQGPGSATQQPYGQQWSSEGQYGSQRSYYDYGQNQYAQQNSSYVGHSHQYNQPRDPYYR